MVFTTVPDKATGDVFDEVMWDLYLRDNINGLIDAVGQRNHLVNPGFEYAQRGGGPFTANGQYTLDMWKIVLGTSSTISVTPETTTVDSNSKQSLKAVYTHSAASQIEQKLEDTKAFQGKTISFAVRVRQGVAGSVRPYISDSGTKTYGAVSATVGAFVTLTVTAAISANASAVTVGVELGASDTVYIDNATLTTGSAALPYVPLQPSDDLARCQRYYETGESTISGYLPPVGPRCQSIHAPVNFNARKGGTPTMTASYSYSWTTQLTTQGASPIQYPGMGGVNSQGFSLYDTVCSEWTTAAVATLTATWAAEWNP